MSTPSDATGRPLSDTVELQGQYTHRSRGRRGEGMHDRTAFVPLLILLLTMLSWSAFQLIQLSDEAQGLEAAKNGQNAQLQQSQRVRQALDALATETRKLADAGNANAKLIVEELRKRGVTISPAAQAGTGK